MNSSLWKLTLLWKSAKSTDSHKSLEKPSAFPQFPQALRAFFLLIFNLKRGATIHLKEADFLS
jgi:hypothetical protein